MGYFIDLRAPHTGSFTGSFSGSVTGALLGTGSWATSASFVSGAYTAQWAPSASYTTTASFAQVLQLGGTTPVYTNPLSASLSIPSGYDFLTYGAYTIASGVLLIVSGRHIIL